MTWVHYADGFTKEVRGAFRRITRDAAEGAPFGFSENTARSHIANFGRKHRLNLSMAGSPSPRLRGQIAAAAFADQLRELFRHLG